MKTVEQMKITFRPSVALLCKLGSIAVHADEATSKQGHPFDLTAIRGLLDDDEVQEWLKQMDKLSMLPKKRNPH
jgi:hypothetical protein